jgi:hypothetical protein
MTRIISQKVRKLFAWFRIILQLNKKLFDDFSLADYFPD